MAHTHLHIHTHIERWQQEGKREGMTERDDTGAVEERKRNTRRKEESVSEQGRAKLGTMNNEREIE